MTFEDYKDKILWAVCALLGTVVVTWSTGVVGTLKDAMTKAEVQEIVTTALRYTPYTQDKAYLDKTIQDIFTITGKLSADIERGRESIVTQNGKLWDEVSKMKIELERLHIRQQVVEEELKKKEVP